MNKPPRTWRGRVFIATSLDGFIARPDGDITWLTDPPPGRKHRSAPPGLPALEWDTFYPTIDHLVMGCATYEKVLTFGQWPYQDKHAIVLSTILADPGIPEVTLARDLEECVEYLDHHAAREVYVDGGKVVQSFLQADLIDELTIATAPVLIGRGLPLFGALERDLHLTTTASHTSDTGMVHTTYTLARPHTVEEST